ncbi:hypothetical protein [Roseivirga pacifica]|uniref:hypothetical protein n=1 Tax=Roseivirga pacifica TaxID=1267423 RepID=UPI003BA9DB61
MMKRNTKYNLSRLIEKKLKAHNISEVDFCTRVGITRSTLLRDKSTLTTDKFSMPEERLRIYAQALDVKIEAILNYSIPQRSVFEPKEVSKSKLLQETQLRP